LDNLKVFIEIIYCTFIIAKLRVAYKFTIHLMKENLWHLLFLLQQILQY